MTRLAVSRLVGCGVLAWGFFLQPCFAQTQTETSHLDAYGNASAIYFNRRVLSPGGVLRNSRSRPVQRYELYSSGLVAARSRVVRGRTSFFTPGERALALALSGTRRSLDRPLVPSLPFVGGKVALTKRKAFEQYGGFGKRLGRQSPAPIGTLLQRRHTLLEATSFTAPVYRAMWRANARGIVLPPSTAAPESVPGEGSRNARGRHLPGVPPVPSREGITLDRHLQQGVAFSLLRLRQEGWSWFREGAYRRAARQFESAAALEPELEGFEPRLGELFCYVSVGAIRTSFAVLNELNLREPNPFAYELNMTDRFGHPGAAGEVRARCQTYALSNGHLPEAVALYAFVLWYLGDRQEAILTVRSAGALLTGTAYADWLTMMQAPRGRSPVSLEVGESSRLPTSAPPTHGRDNR